MHLPTTLREVAQRAGVSLTTASRAINQRGYISSDTANRIRKACLELGYDAPRSGKGLFSVQKKLIGMVVPSIIHPFFGQLCQEMEAALAEQDYAMLLCNINEDVAAVEGVIERLNRCAVDGIIVASHTFGAADLSALSMPLIGFDTIFEQAACTISADHKLGGQMAASHLVKRGCANMLQICGDPSANSDCSKRHQSFMDCVTHAGKTCVSVPILGFQELTKRDFYILVSDILSQYPNIDAVFAADRVAVEVLRYFEGTGTRVPEDVQIISYDGTYLTNLSALTLTTVVQPYEELTRCTVEQMTKLIHGEKVQKSIALDGFSIIQGQTTRDIDH